MFVDISTWKSIESLNITKKAWIVVFTLLSSFQTGIIFFTSVLFCMTCYKILSSRSRAHSVCDAVNNSYGNVWAEISFFSWTAETIWLPSHCFGYLPAIPVLLAVRPMTWVDIISHHIIFSICTPPSFYKPEYVYLLHCRPQQLCAHHSSSYLIDAITGRIRCSTITHLRLIYELPRMHWRTT